MTEAPCASGVEDGAAYSYRLMTHCGVEWAYFDGRYWVPRAKVDTPPDWTPIVEGTMTLEGPRAALFERGSEAIHFVPAAGSFRPAPCA